MMRKTLVAFWICALASFAAGAQTKTDRAGLGLIGPVKTLRIHRTETPLRDGKPGDPKDSDLQLMTFNTAGQLIQDETLNPDGTSSEKWVYLYGANGYPSERSGYESSGRLIWKTTYLYEFDVQGRLSATSMYDADGKLDNRTVRTYDNRGLMTDNTTYDRNGTVSNRSTFVYDDKGKVIEFALYNSTGALVQRQRVINGQNEILLSNPDGSAKSREMRSAPIKDELDAHGNWTRLTANKMVTQSGRMDASLEITRRTITYY